NDKEINEIYQEVLKQYKDFEPHQTKILTAFKYYHYYFPDSIIPDLVTFISGFNYQIAVTKNQLAIGLDMYLGNDYWFYKELMMPSYKVEKLTSNRLAFDAVRSWLISGFTLKKKQPEMVDQMIHS